MSNWLNLRRAQRLSRISFWVWHSRWLRANFEAHRQFHRIREFVFETKEGARIFIALLVSALMSFFSSAIAAVLLLILPFPQIKNALINNYDGLLIAVASIIGIFLSFYFTGINTVIGGVYAKSPKRVRELLIDERVNHFSVRYLVFLTLLCLELLAAGVLLGNRPISSILVVAVLGCFAVLFFAELGKRAFYFFDPSLFARQLRVEILKSAASSTPKGYAFESPEFQEHYRKRCETALDGFQGLIQLARTESHLKETLAEITTELQRTYVNYLWIKRSIPTKSRWFLYAPEFRNWFTASQILVQLASATQTNLQPENKPHHEWLEERLERFCAEILGLALEPVMNFALTMLNSGDEAYRICE